MKYYVVRVYEDVEPELVGPFDSEDERDEKAVSLRAEDPERLHGIYWLDVGKKMGIGAYSGGFMDGTLGKDFRHPMNFSTSG